MTAQQIAMCFPFRRECMVAFVGLGSLLACGDLSPAHAQSPSAAAATSSVDAVVSVKTSLTGGDMTAFQMGGPGMVAIKNASLRFLIEYAYNIQDFQLSGGPDWVDSQKYDVEMREKELPPSRAEGQGSSFEQQRRAMVRSLLGNQFHLRLIEGSKPTPVYALVADQGGPKIPKRKVDPDAIVSVRTRVEKGTLTMSGGSNGELVKVLSGQLGCLVEDRTGLNGVYDIALKWNADSPSSIIAAVQEQLGLKLEEHIAPVPTYVIDAVEKPVSN